MCCWTETKITRLTCIYSWSSCKERLILLQLFEALEGLLHVPYSRMSELYCHQVAKVRTPEGAAQRAGTLKWSQKKMGQKPPGRVIQNNSALVIKATRYWRLTFCGTFLLIPVNSHLTNKSINSHTLKKFPIFENEWRFATLKSNYFFLNIFKRRHVWIHWNQCKMF